MAPCCHWCRERSTTEGTRPQQHCHSLVNAQLWQLVGSSHKASFEGREMPVANSVATKGPGALAKLWGACGDLPRSLPGLCLLEKQKSGLAVAGTGPVGLIAVTSGIFAGVAASAASAASVDEDAALENAAWSNAAVLVEVAPS